jgi:anti-sigma regulatory factor (Ser/Thr protein kinase)
MTTVQVLVDDDEVAERIDAVLAVARITRVDDPWADLTIAAAAQLAAAPIDRPIVALFGQTGRRAAVDRIVADGLRYVVPIDDRLEDALLTMLGRLIHGAPTGLERYVRHGGMVQAWAIADSQAKAAALLEIEGWARSLGTAHLIAGLFIAAIDEMAINALERHARQQLGPIELSAAAEVGRLAVAVRDRVGALRPEQVFGALVRDAARPAGGPAVDAASGRLGFRIMFDTLSTLVIAVEAGRCTEIIGVVDIGKSVREYRDSVPAFAYFADTADAAE